MISYLRIIFGFVNQFWYMLWRVVLPVSHIHADVKIGFCNPGLFMKKLNQELEPKLF